MKPTAIFINTARVGIVDEPVLLKTLKTGNIALTGLDVLTPNPPNYNYSLTSFGLSNLLISPHNARVSIQYQQRLFEDEVSLAIDSRSSNLRNSCDSSG